LQTTYVTSQTEPTIIGQSIAFAKTHLKSILVVYGILFASFGVLRLDQDIQGASDGVSPYRLSQLGSSMDMINHHGPPLTAARDGNPSSFYPLAIDDDRGGFVYLPLAAHFLGTRDIDALLKWSFIIFFASLLLAYPLVLYEITGSVTAAFAAPPILLGHSMFLRTSGFFWLPAWANLALLPILLLMNRRWRQSWLWLLVPLAVVASFASSVRANAGLGFLIGAIVLIIARVHLWRVRLPITALVILAYLSVSSFAMHAVQVQRDEVVGHDFTSPYPNGHPLWHNLYMGLGYLRNPYGIRIKDAAAVAAARKENPTAAFPTKEYEETLRKVYFKTVAHHPEFVAREYLVKAGIVAGSAVMWFPGVIVLLPILLLFGKRTERRQRRFELVLIGGAGLVGVLTGVLVNPSRIAENQSGWYSFLLLAWLLALGWLARPIEGMIFPRVGRAMEQFERLASEVGWRNTGRVLYARGGSHVSTSLRDNRWARHKNRSVDRVVADRLLRLALVGVIAGAILLANAATTSSYASATYWKDQGALIGRHDSAGSLVAQWNQATALRGWSIGAQRVRRDAGELLVETADSRYGHQLESPPLVLRPGRYQLQVAGRVIDGAMRVGVVDDRVRTYIDSGVYWSAQHFGSATRMGVAFELAKEAPIRILFTNYKVNAETAVWSVRDIRMLRLPGGCRLFEPSASFGPLSDVAS
jgi:hypothetical protein